VKSACPTEFNEKADGVLAGAQALDDHETGDLAGIKCAAGYAAGDGTAGTLAGITCQGKPNSVDTEWVVTDTCKKQPCVIPENAPELDSSDCEGSVLGSDSCDVQINSGSFNSYNFEFGDATNTKSKLKLSCALPAVHQWDTQAEFFASPEQTGLAEPMSLAKLVAEHWKPKQCCYTDDNKPFAPQDADGNIIEIRHGETKKAAYASGALTKASCPDGQEEHGTEFSCNKGRFTAERRCVPSGADTSGVSGDNQMAIPLGACVSKVEEFSSLVADAGRKVIQTAAKDMGKKETDFDAVATKASLDKCSPCTTASGRRLQDSEQKFHATTVLIFTGPSPAELAEVVTAAAGKDGLASTLAEQMHEDNDGRAGDSKVDLPDKGQLQATLAEFGVPNTAAATETFATAQKVTMQDDPGKVIKYKVYMEPSEGFPLWMLIAIIAGGSVVLLGIVYCIACSGKKKR